jgi:hypothetical protein
MSWTSRAEAAIRALRDIEDVRIQSDGDAIREIHILSGSNRPAKQIVRDVQTLLLTRFDRAIDHRVVSVAFTGPDAEARKAPDIHPSMPPSPLVAPAPSSSEDRIRFGGVNLYVSGPRVQAQVELQWKGVPRMGSSSGWSTRDGAHRMIAAATVAAVQEFLDDEVALGVADIEFLRMGRTDVVVVGLSLLAHREEKVLVGSCAVDQDAQQAVVLATLAALNRVLGGLRTKEPTEYVLRPSSGQEKSGARRT